MLTSGHCLVIGLADPRARNFFVVQPSSSRLKIFVVWWVSMGFDGSWWVFEGSWWVLMGFDRVLMVLMDFHWVLMGFRWVFRVLLMPKRHYAEMQVICCWMTRMLTRSKSIEKVFSIVVVGFKYKKYATYFHGGWHLTWFFLSSPGDVSVDSVW